MADGLSDTICDHVAGAAFASLPASTVAAAKQVLLDASGVMIAASALADEVQAFIAVARAEGTGNCAVLGTPHRVTSGMAALANGAMAHALDYEDAFGPVPGHPNASLVPALIALAQAREPVSGKRFLTALAVGSDLSCRVGLGLDRPVDQLGWYAPPVIASIGAAAGAARLLDLDAGATRDALSLILCQSIMPGEIKYSRSTVLRAVREGFPAQAAVLSAQLAHAGVAGFEEPLEGRGGFYALFAGGQADAERMLDRLGQHFFVEDLTYKPWPSCRATHSFVEMALALREQHGFAPEDITAIEIVHDSFQAMLIEPMERKAAPQVPIDAKFSIPYCTAVALQRGKLGLDDFEQARLGDPAITGLAATMTHRLDPEAAWSMGAGGALEIALADGSRLSAAQDDALGNPDNPLSQAQLVDKFVECVGKAAVPLEPAAARDLAQAIMSLEQCDDVGALFRW